MALLELADLHAYYGNIHALRGISLTVEDGEIVTLIGANGAGKTTTSTRSAGCCGRATGSVVFDGQDLDQGARRTRSSRWASSRSPRVAGCSPA